MLRLRDQQTTLWDPVLPPGAKVLSNELAAVDALLDDDRFMTPFVERFNTRVGRPTIPIETYLRLMYLKHRYQLGYETLVSEVADSLSWRRFCRLSLDTEVPHSTTLLKLTRRFGPTVVEQLNETVLKTAVQRKLLRSRRLRVDSTVTEADVRYPTDSSLCAHSVSRLGRAVAQVKAVGLGIRTRFRNRIRTVNRLMRRLALGLRRPGSLAHTLKRTGELRELVAAASRQARRVLGKAKKRARRAGKRGQLATAGLAREIALADRVAEQTRRRLAGETNIADRLVSLCDLEARPIRRGSLRKPTEFGYKLALADTPEGFVVAHDVHIGAPLDTDTLEPVLRRAKTMGMRIRTVLADRGFGNEIADQVLQAANIRDKVIPRVGRADPVESTRRWRRRYRFRAGVEGRISALKRRYGLRRSRLKGHAGVRIWVGFGILANNLDRMAALA
jgi:transposase, IS5 family